MPFQRKCSKISRGQNIIISSNAFSKKKKNIFHILLYCFGRKLNGGDTCEFRCGSSQKSDESIFKIGNGSAYLFSDPWDRLGLDLACIFAMGDISHFLSPVAYDKKCHSVNYYKINRIPEEVCFISKPLLILKAQLQASNKTIGKMGREEITFHLAT